MSGPIEPRTCEVCGGAEKRLIFRQRFVGTAQGALLSGYEVVVCGGCGFAYADGLPPQADFDRYYETMSKYEYEHDGGKQVDFGAQRFPEAAAFVGRLLPDRSARILDVGCSNGGLLAELRGAGFGNLLGLDPSPTCARLAMRLHGLRVLTGTLANPPGGVGLHDLVILGAVLEHVRDLRGALAKVRELLLPDGLLYVEVPDATRFSCATDAPFQDFSVEHVNYFSAISLANLAAAAGYEAVAVEPLLTRQSEGTVAWVLNAMFRLVARGAAPAPRRDEETAPALEAYVHASAAVERGIHEELAPWVKSGQPIVVWGVGTHTQRLLATSDLAKAKVAAFVDSNQRYHGTTLAGLPVLPPEALRGRDEPILVSSCLYQGEIVRQIREVMGLRNRLILLYRA